MTEAGRVCLLLTPGGGGAHQTVDRFFEICSVIPYKTPIE